MLSDLIGICTVPAAVQSLLMRCASAGVCDLLGLHLKTRLRQRESSVQRASHLSMASTYSIWIEPQGATADQLQQEINYLADAYGGPTFPPHVTLVGGVTGNEDQVLESARDLAAKLKPYRISFDKPEYGGIYHQCIYMLCQKEQSTMRAGKQSKDVFKQSPSAYMPHLSLLYSDIDEHVRKQAVEVVRRRLESKGADMLQADGFDVHSIHVYRTDPEDKLCKTWKRIKELELTSK